MNAPLAILIAIIIVATGEKNTCETGACSGQAFQTGTNNDNDTTIGAQAQAQAQAQAANIELEKAEIQDETIELNVTRELTETDERSSPSQPSSDITLDEGAPNRDERARTSKADITRRLQDAGIHIQTTSKRSAKALPDKEVSSRNNQNDTKLSREEWDRIMNQSVPEYQWYPRQNNTKPLKFDTFEDAPKIKNGAMDWIISKFRKTYQIDTSREEDPAFRSNRELWEKTPSYLSDTFRKTVPVENLECGLFMAESSIPNSGWGMYTGVPLKRGQPIGPKDVVIQVSDPDDHLKRRNELLTKGESLPKIPGWLLNEYYWIPKMTDAVYDADDVQSIIPGLGMLANSHTGLVNADNKGCETRQVLRRSTREMGAYSTYRDLTFRATKNLPAGHEIMVEYGDSWFEEREGNFGVTLPLSTDFEEADTLLKKFYNLCKRNFKTDFCRDFWKLIREDLEKAIPPRLFAALPENLEEVERTLRQGSMSGTAYHSVPNVIRSLPWLKENGFCLDHMKPGVSRIAHAGEGAHATRHLPKGTVVAPAPLVHLHKDHLAILISDENSKEILWQGHQLLLNYCYGHPSTSLVFFPYAPVVNLINHSKRPNMAIRWSKKMSHNEWFELTTEEMVAENKHAGLMAEFVALRNILEGEELTIDYGDNWQQAWDNQVTEFDDDDEPYREAAEFRDLRELPLESNEHKEERLPPNVMTVCWFNPSKMKAVQNRPNTYTWGRARRTSLDESRSCSILSRQMQTYTVRVIHQKKVIKLQGVPRVAITVVDRAYTTNQFVRFAFRHRIELPDHMIPRTWRDLDRHDEECGLYMAASSIPNSGFGMYTAKYLEEKQSIFYPDVVVQVEDFNLNQKLRAWYNGRKKLWEPKWLIENYYWNSENTMGTFEAGSVWSVVPGLGMLANSHTGLVNALMRRPQLDSAGTHRQSDEMAGSFSWYHGLGFVTSKRLEAGSELFVAYGDSWFEDRTDLGLIPLSTDFEEADQMINQFSKIVRGNTTSEMARDLWKFIDLSTNKDDTEDNRIRVALPKKFEDVDEAAKYGTARLSVPNFVRSISWLKANGRCLDNIKPAKSTQGGIGRGAFATRRIKRGEVVAPVPLVHMHRDRLRVYDSEDVQNRKSPVTDKGFQQLINYCFGHWKSNVLLYPYSPVSNFVNHAAHTKANVHIRWSDLSDSSLLELTVQELMEVEHAGLVMEFVASRDIEKGEEVFFDYGSRWEERLNQYKAKFKANREESEYSPSFEWNDYLEELGTVAEEKKEPTYPDNIVFGCHHGELGERSGKTKDGLEIFKWVYEKDLYETMNNMYECEIIGRKLPNRAVADAFSIRPSTGTYTVRIKEDEEYVVTDVPRRAIEVVDSEYTSDLFLRDRWRMEIQLPDTMLPEHWFDLGEN